MCSNNFVFCALVLCIEQQKPGGFIGRYMYTHERVVLFSLDPFSYSYHFLSPPAPVCVCDVTSFEIGSVAMSSKGRTEGGGLVHSRGENSICLLGLAVNIPQ